MFNSAQSYVIQSFVIGGWSSRINFALFLASCESINNISVIFFLFYSLFKDIIIPMSIVIISPVIPTKHPI
jgi:hypothetical protein